MPVAMKQSILPSPLLVRSAKSSSQSLDSEQDVILETALAKVQQFSSKMIQSLDAGKLMDAIQCCSSLLNELRAGHLSPKMYYTLYIAVSDTLGYLSLYLSDNFLKEEVAKLNAVKLVDLYELVQYAGNIIPRLYLLLTVGAIWLQSPCVPWTSTEVDKSYSVDDYATCKSALLKDMLEMTRGVQHPIRGLFLRHYLSSLVKDQLPDVQLDVPLSNSAAFQDSVDFILTNFAEMNKLWVRLSFLGPSKDREKREAERMELRILIGTNLVRLSQLEGVDLVFYKNVVLPAILCEIVGCGDKVAQEYLMEVLVQVFSNEYHLHTLSTLLESTTRLQPLVNISAIYQDLMLRLCEFVQSQPLRVFEASELAAMSDKEREERVGERVIPGNVDLFQVFFSELGSLVQNRADFSLEETLRLAYSLQKLSLAIYPNHLSNLELVLRFVYDRLSFLSVICIDVQHVSAGVYLMNMISLAIEVKPHVLSLLCLDVTSALVARFLSLASRKNIAFKIIDFFLEANASTLESRTHIEKLLRWMSPLIHTKGTLSYLSPSASPTRSLRESILAASPFDASTKSLTQEPFADVEAEEGEGESEGESKAEESWSFAQLEELVHEQGRLCRFLNLCQPYALCAQSDMSRTLVEADAYFSLLHLLAEELKQGGSLRFRFTGHTLFYLARAAFLFLMSVYPKDMGSIGNLLEKYVRWMLRLLGSLAYGDDEDEEMISLLDQLGHALPTFTFSCSFDARERKESKGLKSRALSYSWSLYSSFASKGASGIIDFHHPQTMSTRHFNPLACFSKSYTFELAFRLALDASCMMQLPALRDVTYEALAESLVWYEEGIVDSRAQVAALSEFMNTLSQVQNLSSDTMHLFIAKGLAYSGQILRRQESVRLVSYCAYLYYPPQPGSHARDEERACVCLLKAMHLAKSISDGSVKVIALLDLMDVARVLDETGCNGVQTIIQDLSALVELAIKSLSGACFPTNIAWIMDRARGQKFKLHHYELHTIEKLALPLREARAGLEQPQQSKTLASSSQTMSGPETDVPAAASQAAQDDADRSENDADRSENDAASSKDAFHVQLTSLSHPESLPLAMELPPEFRDTHNQWLSDENSPSSPSRKP